MREQHRLCSRWDLIAISQDTGGDWSSVASSVQDIEGLDRQAGYVPSMDIEGRQTGQLKPALQDPAHDLGIMHVLHVQRLCRPLSHTTFCSSP